MRSISCVLAVLGFAGVTNAQVEANPSAPPSDDAPNSLSTVSTAREAYEIGARLFEAARYQDAERAWLRAYELDPSPSLLLAIADAREKRGDEPGTVSMLERYLEERPDAPDEQPIRARIAALLETPATIVVRSEEEGHAILLDGKPIGPTTPAEIEVEPGLHTIIVVGDGREVGEQTVQVAYGDRRELIFAAIPVSEVSAVESKPEPDGRQPRAKRSAWALSGVSAATLLTGTVLGFTALEREQDYRSDPTAQTADRGNRLALFADVSFGLAALSAITALTLFLTTKNRKKKQESARLKLETRGSGAAAAIRF